MLRFLYCEDKNRFLLEMRKLINETINRDFLGILEEIPKSLFYTRN